MQEGFKKPDFSTGDIELSFQQGEVCIYTTRVGLEKLIQICNSLKSKPQGDHVHLEDYEVLTTKSLRGTIAQFPSP